MSVRRYAIEVTDVDTDQIELLIAADWTEEEKRIALAQILRLPGVPDDIDLVAPDPKRGKG
jgi:hypothetical protein